MAKSKPKQVQRLEGVEPCLVNFERLSVLTSLSVRTLRRMDADREIPGRRLLGRRILFHWPTVQEWAAAGCRPVAEFEKERAAGRAS